MGCETALPLPLNIYDFEMICHQIEKFSKLINYFEYREANYEFIISIDELEIFESFMGEVSFDHSTNSKTAPIGYTEELDQKMYSEFAEYVRKYPFKTIL